MDEPNGEMKSNPKSREEVLAEWKKLVNMSPSELEKFMQSTEGKEAGLSRSEAAAQGIRSGQDSARAILRMKGKNPAQWSDGDWQWAARQVAFIKRMRGASGELRDAKNQPTRKLLALKIWGHDPEKKMRSNAKPSSGSKLDRLGLAVCDECGVRLETGVPVELHFMHNTERSPKPTSDDPYQQRIEPTGYYALIRCPDDDHRQPGWEYGKARITPLVLERNTKERDEQLYGPHSWKARLNEYYGRKRGKVLAQAIVRDGYDAIITVGPYGTGEVVLLDPGRSIIGTEKTMKSNIAPSRSGSEQDADLSSIRILYRDADTLALWGIPYEMRPGQQPRDLRDHPRRGWIFLGYPGWWGNLSRERQREIERFLEKHRDEVPGGPYEWSRLDKQTPNPSYPRPRPRSKERLIAKYRDLKKQTHKPSRAKSRDPQQRVRVLKSEPHVHAAEPHLHTIFATPAIMVVAGYHILDSRLKERYEHEHVIAYWNPGERAWMRWDVPRRWERPPINREEAEKAAEEFVRSRPPTSPYYKECKIIEKNIRMHQDFYEKNPSGIRRNGQPMSWVDVPDRRDWPEFEGWHFYDTDHDKWGDATAGVYEHERPLVRVEVTATGKWKVPNTKLSGSWDVRAPTTLKRALDQALGEHVRQQEQQGDTLLRFLGKYPQWECMYDEGELSCYHRSRLNVSDAVVNIWSLDADDLGTGHPVQVRLRFEEGSDYEGAYGVQEKNFTIRSAEELAPIIEEAERMLEAHDSRTETELAEHERGRRRTLLQNESSESRGGQYWVWLVRQGSNTPLSGEGPYGPHDLDGAKTFARIGATEGEHDRVVSRGRDPDAPSFEIVRRYRSGDGKRLL